MHVIFNAGHAAHNGLQISAKLNLLTSTTLLVAFLLALVCTDQSRFQQVSFAMNEIYFII